MVALQNVFLFVEPLQHYLRYGSCVLHEVVEANRRPGQIIVELVGDEANPENIKRELERLEPALFCGIGHGNVNVYSVECTETLVTVGSAELDLFKDKIVQLNSCLTAQQLGPALIDAGARAYKGSREEFWFYIGDEPCASRSVRAPFLPEYEFTASLMRGNTVGKAWDDHLTRTQQEIDYWFSGAGKNHPDAPELSRILQINKNISTVLGEKTAVATTPTRKAMVIPVFAIGFLVVGAVLYKGLTLPEVKL